MAAQRGPNDADQSRQVQCLHGEVDASVQFEQDVLPSVGLSPARRIFPCILFCHSG